VNKFNNETADKVKKSLEKLAENLDNEPTILIDAKGHHLVNDTALRFISEKGISMKEFVEWVKIGSSHLQNLNYSDIDVHMIRLPNKDVIALLRHQRRKEPVHDDCALTRKEKEIVRYLVKGFSNKKIAGLLKISPGTVNTHLDNIYRKLGCSNRVAACITAVKNGLFLPSIDLPSDETC
jgi:DNA-binding NarL/FixJ family response regulator